MDWRRDLPTWPRSETSRRVASRPHRWHVQEAGAGPDILLLHGAGGATHSWRDVIPPLTGSHRVLAVDLPGQGFTEKGTGLRLGPDAMAADLAALAAREGWRPVAIVGHSAGGALALRLAGRVAAADGAAPAVVGFNAALMPFEGRAEWLFPALARMLALNPFVPSLVAAGAGRPASVQRIIAGTGSVLGPEGIALYARLVADGAHVDGTLRMMAQWSLDALARDLPAIAVPVTLVTADGDLAVPPQTAERAQAALPDARLERLDGLGHLAHEEAPDRAAAIIAQAAARRLGRA